MFFVGQKIDIGQIPYLKIQLNQVVLLLKTHVKSWFVYPSGSPASACPEMRSLMVEYQIPVPGWHSMWNKN